MAEHSKLPAGTVLDERYRIDELLSVGGMGAVYAGSHLLLEKRVAVKVLRTDLPGAARMQDRFRREAIAASAIGHENIVQVTDMGITPDGTAYMVMELLEGCDLGEALSAGAPLPTGRACRIASSMLRGLGAAHQAGIVHRDLKPENVFLVRRGDTEVVKLLDFGVSLLKRPEGPDMRLTFTGQVVGTPRYMSPEQARGDQDLTGAADIYAAGVVSYEMLAGTLPYVGDNYNSVIHEIIAAEWAPLESRRPDLPGEIVEAVHRALALSPEDRFATAEEMADAIEPFAGGPAHAVHAAPDNGTGRSFAKPARSPAAFEATALASRPAGGARPKVPRPSDSLIQEPAWAGKTGSAEGGPPKAPRLAGDSGRFFAGAPEPRPVGSRRHVPLALLGAAGLALVTWILWPSGGESSAGADQRAGLEGSRVESVPASPDPERTPDPISTSTTKEPAAANVPSATKPVAKRPAAGDPAAAGRAAEAPNAAPSNRPGASPPPAAPDQEREHEPEKSAPGKKEPVEKAPVKEAPTVTIELLVVPPSATARLGGKELAGRQIVVERSKKPLAIQLEAEGYTARTIKVVPDQDRELVIQLSPKPPRAESEPPKSASPPANDSPEAESPPAEEKEPAPASPGKATPDGSQ